MHHCDRTTFSASELGHREAILQFRPIIQRHLELSILGRVCHYNDTDFVVGDWRDVGLSPFTPINFHEIGPRADPVMTPRGVPAGALSLRVETAPAANARTAAIRADYPAGFDMSRP